MHLRRLIFAFVVCAVAACSTENPPAPAPPVAEEGSAEPAPQDVEPTVVVVPPASAWLHGEFEYRVSHMGREVRQGLKVGEGVLERTNQGQVTASEPFRVVEDVQSRIVIELLPTDGPPKVRELIFDGEDTVWDAAAPELRYLRIAHGAPAAEGSADGAGAGEQAVPVDAIAP